MAKAMLLSELLALLNMSKPEQDAIVSGLCEDSRQLQNGEVFFALSGFHYHGMDYAQQAVEKGALAIITEPVIDTRPNPKTPTNQVSIPIYEVAGLSQQLGSLASAFYQHPSHDVAITAVTGTNGKTSTAYLLSQALNDLGQKAGYMGTLGVGELDNLSPLPNTTPSAFTIQRNLAELRDRGFKHVCLEVSSHGLDQGRLNGSQINTAIYTNLSQDHLDYHQTMEAYANAKRRLFTDFSLQHAVINLMDEWAVRWLELGIDAEQISGYAAYEDEAKFTANWDSVQLSHRACNIHLNAEGVSFDWQFNHQQQNLTAGLLGAFNVENILAVVAALTHFGINQVDVAKAVAKLKPVPGRMNSLTLQQKPVTVVIDFAHTPDALRQVLRALRGHCQQQLWCVFGCGGNRDSGKRPQMGQIAEQQADCVIITDDNPRFESGPQITADIAAGMQHGPLIINDRKAAIEHALNHAKAGDIVLIAGKGHETTQQINDQFIEFNDLQVVQDWQGVAA